MKITSPAQIESLSVNTAAKEFTDLYYDKQDILQKFNISSRTLQRWRSDNVITYKKIGGKYFYPKDQFVIEVSTIQQTEKTDSGIAIPVEGLPEKTDNITIDTITSQQSDILRSKSFAKVWDPIPGYVVPVLIMFIYFTPYLNDLIAGRYIDSFLLIVPLLVAGVGVAAFLLLQIGIAISRKISGSRRTS